MTPILIADPPLLNAMGVHQPYTPRLIVEVETQSGTVGVGETYGDSMYLKMAGSVAQKIVGRQLTALNGLVGLAGDIDSQTRARLSDRLDVGGLRGVLNSQKLRASVISAFEVACLDALGKEVGLPVHALLGGKVRSTVEYSGYLFYRWAEHPIADAPQDNWGAAMDAAGIVEQARQFAERYGFKSFKLKGGVLPADDEIDAIFALRREFDSHALRLDPNGSWPLETGVRVAQTLSDTLEYLEDPVLGVEHMAEVHRRTGVPLATNMCVTTLAEIPAAFAADAVQIVLSDHHYWGGLLATRDLAGACRSFDVEMSMHSNTHLGVSLAAMTHVASTLVDLHYACDTHRPWQTEDVITEPAVFTNSCIEVSDRPGLGIELDQDSLERMHERWIRHPHYRERDDQAALQCATEARAR